jgi:hypothetical protein
MSLLWHPHVLVAAPRLSFSIHVYRIARSMATGHGLETRVLAVKEKLCYSARALPLAIARTLLYVRCHTISLCQIFLTINHSIQCNKSLYTRSLVTTSRAVHLLHFTEFEFELVIMLLLSLFLICKCKHFINEPLDQFC